MEFFDLVNISEQYIDLASPTTPDKILTLGQYLRLRPGFRVIDFACGFPEPLALWAERFGITGVGVEVREHACQKARTKLAERGLSDQIEIVCGQAAEYEFEAQAFDAATCIGASFVFGGYRPTIAALKAVIDHLHKVQDDYLTYGRAYLGWAMYVLAPVL